MVSIRVQITFLNIIFFVSKMPAFILKNNHVEKTSSPFDLYSIKLLIG